MLLARRINHLSGLFFQRVHFQVDNLCVFVLSGGVTSSTKHEDKVHKHSQMHQLDRLQPLHQSA